MKRKYITVTATILLMHFLVVDLAIAAEEIPKELQLITKNVFIKTQEVIEPPLLTSTPGTTIVWVNISEFPIEIIFVGKGAAIACGSPMNFSIDKDGAFHSAIIPRGGTASLCFIEKGTYVYKVESSRTLFMEYGKRERKESRGTIEIK